jgi:hypothetical protein
MRGGKMSSTKDYEGMTKAELQDEIDARGLEVAPGTSKSDLITILEADDSGEIHEKSSSSDEVAEIAAAPADFSTGGSTVQTVDVATIPESDNPDEHFQLTGESWVVLGAAPDLPDWAVGQPAAVLDAPVSTKRDDEGNELYTYTAPDAVIRVRERSQGAYFSVPFDTVQKVALTGGRSEVVNFP